MYYLGYTKLVLYYMFLHRIKLLREAARIIVMHSELRNRGLNIYDL